MSDCSMSVKFNLARVVEEISKHVEVDFLTPESRPTSLAQGLQCAFYILQDLVKRLQTAQKDIKLAMIFSKALGLLDCIDHEKELSDLADVSGCPEILSEAIKEFLALVKKNRNKTKDGCEHE